MIKYSVIVPVFNAEKTLRRCIDSLLNQKYTDMELILVNDGSRDDSLAICNAYQANDARVRVIDKPNGGVSAARNAGLDAASGKYILFVDSDDYVAPNYFSALDALCAETDYECVFFSQNVVEGTVCRAQKLEAFASCNIDECVSKFAQTYYRKTLNSPINKRYIRSLIEKKRLRFSESLSIGEDKIFCLQYILQCRSCCITSDTLYNVSVDNKDSLSRKPRTDLVQQFTIMDKLIEDIIRSAEIPEEHRKQYIAAENLVQLRSVYSEAKRMHLSKQPWKMRRKTISRMCIDFNRDKKTLPEGKFSTLLRIPVEWKLTGIIDFLGWYLAR